MKIRRMHGREEDTHDYIAWAGDGICQVAQPQYLARLAVSLKHERFHV
jgi:hypothetical protein